MVGSLTIVSQVRAIDRDRLPVGEYAHVLPDYLLVAERRPPMRPALLLKVSKRAPNWGLEQRLAGDRVVVGRHGAAVNLRMQKCGHMVG